MTTDSHRTRSPRRCGLARRSATSRAMSPPFLCLLLIFALLLFSERGVAQPAPGGPPAVGVVRAERQQITQSDEFIGRVQAVNRVALVARVTGFLEKRLFVEGGEVKRGDLLYQIEQPPFQAQVDANKATVD
jgi:membrane fusion protein (multidrug efflux system)